MVWVVVRHMTDPATGAKLMSEYWQKTIINDGGPVKELGYAGMPVVYVRGGPFQRDSVRYVQEFSDEVSRNIILGTAVPMAIRGEGQIGIAGDFFVPGNNILFFAVIVERVANLR